MYCTVQCTFQATSCPHPPWKSEGGGFSLFSYLYDIVIKLCRLAISYVVVLFNFLISCSVTRKTLWAPAKPNRVKIEQKNHV